MAPRRFLWSARASIHAHNTHKQTNTPNLWHEYTLGARTLAQSKIKHTLSHKTTTRQIARLCFRKHKLAHRRHKRSLRSLHTTHESSSTFVLPTRASAAPAGRPRVIHIFNIHRWSDSRPVSRQSRRLVAVARDLRRWTRSQLQRVCTNR